MFCASQYLRRPVSRFFCLFLTAYSSKHGVQWEDIAVASLVPKLLRGGTLDETKMLCLCLSSRGPALGHSASTLSFASSATLMKQSDHVLK